MIVKAIVIIVILLIFAFLFQGNLHAVDSILDIITFAILVLLIISGITAIMEAVSKEDEIEPGELIVRVILGIIAFILLVF